LAKHFFKKILLLALLVFFLFGLNRFIWPNFLGVAGIYSIKYPSRWLQTGVSFFTGALSSFTVMIKSRSGTVAEIERLQNENLALLAKNQQLQEVERENDYLRKQLGLAGKIDRQLLSAKIFFVSRNAGSSFVYVDWSKVVLIEDAQSSTSVRIGSTGVLGSVGRTKSGGGRIEIDLVTSEEKIEVGDLVVTSGFDNFPAGLLVGRVSSVDLKGGSIFQTVEVDLFFNLFTNPNLFIFLPRN
jgi:cell shape-determining protein MreC